MQRDGCIHAPRGRLPVLTLDDDGLLSASQRFEVCCLQVMPTMHAVLKSWAAKRDWFALAGFGWEREDGPSGALTTGRACGPDLTCGTISPPTRDVIAAEAKTRDGKKLLGVGHAVESPPGGRELR